MNAFNTDRFAAEIITRQAAMIRMQNQTAQARIRGARIVVCDSVYAICSRYIVYHNTLLLLLTIQFIHSSLSTN